jgi:hypothetical protein
VLDRRVDSPRPILQTSDLPRPQPSDGPLVPNPVSAAVVGLATLGLYLATLQPDFGGPEDTPKFQFLGYVLGTAHPPGYPLYSWLSHLFVVTIRVGTIAYRANLLSAVLAAGACVAAFAIAKRIGASRWASVCAAVALGTGASLWRSAVFAEVYSLAALLVGGTVALLLAWNGRRHAGRLLAAIGIFALGLGNHLTIVGLVPACVLYVLLRNRRVLTTRVAGSACVLLAAGVAQYGLVILRTHQEAPYLESRASSVRELIGIITAERYAGQRFAFSPWVILTQHLPAVSRVMGEELGVAGVLLLAIGLLRARTERASSVALLAGAAAGLLFMVLNLEGDLNGFITPVMVLLWPIAALGATAAGQTLRDYGPTRSISAAAAVAIAAVLPAFTIASNFRHADQSANTEPGIFFRALFHQLPSGSGVVAENYFYDMAIHYMTLTGEGGPRRGIGRVGFDAAAVRAAYGAGAGHVPVRRVFAFASGALFLGTDGLQFARADIVGVTLDEWLRGVPRGTLVTGSAAFVPAPIDLSGADHSHARPPGRPRTYEAFALRAGTSDAVWRGGDDHVSLTVEPPVFERIAALGGSLVLSADRGGARVALSGVQIASVEAGIAVAAFSPDGAFLRSQTFAPGEPLRMPFLEALYELAGETPCVNLTSEQWTDLSPVLATGGWIAALPAIGSVAIEMAIPPSGPRMQAQSTQLMGDGSTGTSITAGADGDRVFTTEMTRSSESRAVFRLSVDAPAPHALARVRPGGVRSALKVCAHQAARPLFTAGSTTGTLKADFESEAYYGPGWNGAERNQAGSVRHGDTRAALLLPLPRGFTYRIALDLSWEGDVPVTAALNGHPLGTCEAHHGGPCELVLGPGTLEEGVSVLVLERLTAGAPARRPLIFRGARISRQPATAAGPAR